MAAAGIRSPGTLSMAPGNLKFFKGINRILKKSPRIIIIKKAWSRCGARPRSQSRKLTVAQKIRSKVRAAISVGAQGLRDPWKPLRYGPTSSGRRCLFLGCALPGLPYETFVWSTIPSYERRLRATIWELHRSTRPGHPTPGRHEPRRCGEGPRGSPETHLLSFSDYEDLRAVKNGNALSRNRCACSVCLSRCPLRWHMISVF